MQGRVEHKRTAEFKMQEKINNMPKYIKKYYNSMRYNEYTTKNRYLTNTIRFLEYLNGEELSYLSNIELENIDKDDIENYIDSIRYIEKNKDITELKPATINCILSSLNSFFDFLVEEEYVKINPFKKKKIKRPKVLDKPIVFLNPEEIKIVENSIIEGVGNKTAKSKQEDWKYRDYLLFRIPSVTGIRVTALSEINLSDINLRDKKIRATEKFNIEKDIYLDEKTCLYIERWLRQRKEILGEEYKSEMAFFISNRKTRITVRSIERIIQKYTEESLHKHITPHKLRSSCGTNLYQKTKDIYLVANVLGHSSMETVKKYVNVKEKEREEAINIIAKLYE